MPYCNYCRTRLTDDPDGMAARCSSCHQPLYENVRDPHQRGPSSEPGTSCVAHPANPAVGVCQRCGNFLCSVCRTRWRYQVVCMACVQRSLESREALPTEARAHLRQGIVALLLGGGAWLASLAAFGLMALGASQGPVEGLAAIGFGMLLFLASPLPALLGVGQAAAAIRVRGDHMILATVGLVLSGLHTGITLGLVIAVALFREVG